MEIKIHSFSSIQIAELISANIEIQDVDDAIDLMANSRYLGADGIVIHEHNLNPDFFKLSTRLAGEILQKFSNYRMRLAIVGDFSKYSSKSLKDFIYESNKNGRILFLPSLDVALSKLSDN